MRWINVQKLAKKYDKAIDRALAYYSVFFALNRVKISRKELELVAFTAVRGTITPLSARQEFVEQFNSSLASIENIKGRLVKRGIIVSQNRMFRVNPKFTLDFEKPIILQINLDDNGKDNG